ncbi:MAG: sensor histidine kinase [Alphaproteobacteria bacterium]
MSEADGARRRRRVLGSPLTWRILAVNLMAPIILVAGLLYVDQYEQALIASELAALRTNAEVIAAAVGEGAVAVDTVLWDPEAGEVGQTVPNNPVSVLDPGTVMLGGIKVIDPEAEARAGEFGSRRRTIVVPVSGHRLLADKARLMIRRLAEPADVRARLFGTDGALVADSRLLTGPGGMVQVEDLPPPDDGRTLMGGLRGLYDRVLHGLSGDASLPVYGERARQAAADYGEVQEALGGEPAGAVRAYSDRGRLLSVAVPVQHYKRVVGALMLSHNGEPLEENLFNVRLAILEMFFGTALLTVLLSIYLSGTIARPITRLADAAERVRSGHGRREAIPEFGSRHDEIGELALALREMVDALWQRMDAIERFAADVAHEIKNPLTSIRSAVETVARVGDPERQKRLMAVIQDDVTRLDRLISDISDASRLDAELSRAESGPVQVRRLLETLVEVYGATTGPEGPSFALAIAEADAPADDPLTVEGIEGRLVQVIRNLIANAVSFSPPGGTITLRAGREEASVWMAVEDEGPGIPAGREDAIFDRFYRERPSGETFGAHSGLGLSISRQIVTAHGGTITATNRPGPVEGASGGARFVIRLPIGSAGAISTRVAKSGLVRTRLGV